MKVQVRTESALGRRERHKLATRAELVRAGRRLFGERGLYEARVEDLAERADIAKGTVYLYFRNKEELVGAVVGAGYEELERFVAAASEGARSLEDLILRIGAAHFEFFTRNPDWMRIFHQARGMLKFDRPEWRGLRAPLEQHVDFLARLLGAVRSPAWASRARRRQLAMAILGMVSGVASVHAAMESGRLAGTWKQTVSRALSRLATDLAPGPSRGGPSAAGATPVREGA